MNRFLVFLVFALAAAAQEKAPAKAELSSAEEEALSSALAEAGSSPVEFLRALEKHLARFPDSPRKPDLERAAVKAAIEVKDEKRILLYGERVLQRDTDDLQVLDRVTRALLSGDNKENAARAIKYARRYGELLEGMRKEEPPGRMSPGQWQEEVDRGLGRALALEARASGNLDKLEEAAALARRSYELAPTAEAAREIARWLARSGNKREAVLHLADAFTIVDAKAADSDRSRDRNRMGELYRELNGSEKGLGDLVLEAYDRTTALLAARRLRLRENDPNSGASQITEFTLTGVHGGKLPLATLKGKVIVFDFWATWCAPCRVQHPLYEEVKKRFRDRSDVVFLAVSTDEERDIVAPFLKENGWQGQFYFEDGLSRTLQISSIPTTLIVDRRGEVFSRMNGFLPERFVEMLSERIRDALAK